MPDDFVAHQVCEPSSVHQTSKKHAIRSYSRALAARAASSRRKYLGAEDAIKPLLMKSKGWEKDIAHSEGSPLGGFWGLVLVVPVCHRARRSASSDGINFRGSSEPPVAAQQARNTRQFAPDSSRRPMSARALFAGR